MDYWNALLKRLLQQSTLLIDINETDNNVIKMFVHKGSTVVVRGNALTLLLRSMADLCFGLLFLRPLSYLLPPTALASFPQCAGGGILKDSGRFLPCSHECTHSHIASMVDGRCPPGRSLGLNNRKAILFRS